MTAYKRERLIQKLSVLLRDNGYSNVHFGSFNQGSPILLPEVDIVIDNVCGVWFVYTSERGIFTSMVTFNTLSELNKAISNHEV